MNRAGHSTGQMARTTDLISLLGLAMASPAAAQPTISPSQAVPPAPNAADPELSAPLVPLSSFDVRPVEAPPADDAKPTTIRYDLSVDGLDGTDVEARFRPLSTLRDNGRKSESAAQIKARADEDAELLTRILRSEGWFDARVDAVIAPATADARAKVTLTATRGERYTLGTITLTGPETQPPGLAREAFKLTSGTPIVAADIESAEANIRIRLPEQGYPFADLGPRDILLDDVTHRGDYTLPVKPGLRSSFAGIRLGEERPVLPAKHVATIARFKPGQLYDNRKVDDLRRALIATSLYSSVSVEPVDTGVKAADGTEAVDMLVRGVKGPRRTLAGNVGYATGEGLKAQGTFTDRNRFPPEGALIFDVIAGTNIQSASAIVRKSNFRQRDRTLQASVSAANQNFDAYNAKSLTVAASLARTSTPIWQKRWTWSVGAELIGSQEKNFDLTRSLNRDRTYLIGALPVQLGYDRSDSLLDPTRGFRVNLRNSPEVSFQNSVFGYDRSLAEVTGYYPIGGSIVLAGRVRETSIFGASTERIAPTRRVYAGGGGSVRGFGFQQLGPKDANNDPVGGRSSIEFAGEVRYRFGGVFGIVPFIDGGQVYDASLPKFTSLRYGAGIGARYYTNFGPLRFDVATPLGRKPGESRVAIYISIGQAF